MLEKHVRVRRTAVARDVDQGKGDGCDGHFARDRYERGTPLGPQLTLTRLRAVPWTERVFVDGKGCWLTSDGGERFLDMAAGIGVVNVGHCHPHVVAAIQAQAAKIIHAQVRFLLVLFNQRMSSFRFFSSSFFFRFFENRSPFPVCRQASCTTSRC